MKPVRLIEGKALRLPMPNIDTDLIIAARHLKTVSRAGLGRFAFEAIRQPSEHAFVLGGGPILLAGANFGCGSSREHAVWALQDAGIEAVVAPSFSDIFASNAFKNGLLTVALPAEAIDRIGGMGSDANLRIDLQNETLHAGGEIFTFKSDPFRRECMLAGRDEIDLTMTREDAILAYEAKAVMLSWETPRPGERMSA